jgi:hypothetical protein
MTLQRQALSLFKIKIASGTHHGFYVGLASRRYLGRCSSHEESPLALLGFSYMLYINEDDAVLFGSSAALTVQRELRDLGVDSELL